MKNLKGQCLNGVILHTGAFQKDLDNNCTIIDSFGNGMSTNTGPGPN